MDALSHCFVDGRMYNGYDANEISSQGTRQLGIEQMANGVVTRGVLVDMPRFKHVPWLEPGYGITAEEWTDRRDELMGTWVDAVQ